jgi:pyruvate ferredoxin oxidoreductase gamma subunit
LGKEKPNRSSKKMKEIRIHGRGGQGVVTAAELLAVAAHADGKYAQAIPSFGSERMGAPVQSFVRISEEKILMRTHVYNPDFLIVQDATLIGAFDIFSGLKDGGLILVNSEKRPEEIKIENGRFRVATVPATRIALEILKRPIPNTILIGAFAGLTGVVTLEGVKVSIRHRFTGEIAMKNEEAVEYAYKLVKGGKE